MKKVLSISVCIMALVVIALWAPDTSAFKFYSQNVNDIGNCADCHLGFRETGNYFSNKDGAFWGTSLHNGHLNNTTVGSSCDNCHGGADITSVRMVNLSSSGNAADGVNAIACSGCHVGPGLRAHHAANGITDCAVCHSDPTPATENIAPPWFGSVINDITGTNLEPCNANGEEDFAGSTLGLDNDGDNAYDTADPDCDVCVPTGLPDDNCDGIDDDCNGTADDAYVPTQTFCGVGVCANTGLLECQDGQLVDTCVELPQDEATDVTCDGRDSDCDGSIDEDYTPVPTTCGVGDCAGNTGAEECQNGVIVDTCDPLAGAAADDATCDGLDNDCDGAIDEDFASTPTSCGVGECAATGATTCVSGVEGDTCTPGTPAADDATCDGLDNDCDGTVDEDFASTPTSCGVGECAATGVTECVGGTEGDTCTPGTPAADDSTCDGLDNDCDGAIDEDYVTTPTTCGVGECAATGVTECVGGVEGDTCTPGSPAADDSTCDGLDNDCDGAIDEDYASTPTSCGVGECAATGATTCVSGIEGDTCTPGTPAAEICDNLDNNCDGSIDESLTQPTSCGVGECGSTGVETCTTGVWGGDTCTPGSPTAEVCDNLDNNCDGSIDESLTQPTSCGVGECGSTGVETCTAGVWGGDTCTPGTPAADDSTCDGLDNDCDGAVDEDYAPIATSCGVGDCAATGVTECVAGVESDTCTPGTPAADDATCDGLDNDCDSAIDEDYAPMATTCGVGECAATGVTECVAGVESDSCTPGTPAADDATCDGLDNDCDGAIDEDYAPMATTCGVGECAATGVTECVAGVESDSCTPGTPAADDATCDGLDNDCDGAVDEDYAPIATSCGVGECAATGVTECVAGVESDTCTPGSPAADDATCDGLDNDCDGTVDEDYMPMATTCGIGECAATGVTECVAGVESDSCTPGTPAADDSTCDGLDNDCDGAIDEDYATVATSCGVGECAATGVTECVAGVEGDTCTPGTPAADDATCDGLDNDCDGAIDEDYMPMATTCGIGECAATGATTCVDGVESDTCTPGSPAADDATCDGSDNDCDGTVDEDYMPMATTCGIGECAATGVTECVAGVESDSCTPGTPAADDSTCDGLDNDCDGAIDEDYASTPTTCGIGECAATGATTCVDGVESDTCTPGSPAADDSTCDGLDNDCDGAIDEDYVTTPTTCGVGECAATGVTECVAGVESDSCTPGTPAADDATCDGLDNDCDSAIDEDYAPMATTCGVGECAATGVTECVAGVESDTCTPGIPAADEATCDGLDNDCDGAIDEDYAPMATTCGVGECAATGATTCVDGVESDTCTPGTPAADDSTCDGLDNDCDGAIDEDYASTPTTCGIGECAATGATTCVDGVESDTCTPGTPAADDATCDGLDNDCDGAVDEDFAPIATSCGVGECAATGVTECVGGVEGDTCTPGTPAADDATCDGLDNDCDGAVDEDYTPMATTCGIGECAATGLTTCVGGIEDDTCTPGTPAADDATCDGLDNDCDGATDEDYAPMATTCGVGECAATGQTTCVGGTEGDTCTPGTPAAELCDGLDNDCDSATDEDFTNLGTMCTVGRGACEATGTNICTADGLGTECSAKPGTPGVEGPPRDPTCSDAIDNDCDGLTDMGDSDCALITTVPGDCNADGVVDAGDISALVLEIFDGDGNLPADTPRGTFPGDPVGSDANEDGVVDAGDISCTVLLIFSGPGACGG